MRVVAEKSRKSGKRFGYLDVMAVASKPGDQRRAMPIGRGGAKVAPRKFHLSDDEIAAHRLAHKEGDKLPNPQNRGSYFYIIEAGKKLGVNKRHPMKTVIATIRELMSDPSTKKTDKETDKVTTAWQRFRDKEASTDNDENALEAEDRIIQNMEVLQRTSLTSTTPYGLKLLQIGQKVLHTKGVVIDLLKGDGNEILFRLNTDAKEPTNELKRRRGSNGTGTVARTSPAKKAAAESRKPKTKAVAAKVVKAAKKAGKVKPAPADRSDKVTAAAAPESDAKSDLAAAEPASPE